MRKIRWVGAIAAVALSALAAGVPAGAQSHETLSVTIQGVNPPVVGATLEANALVTTDPPPSAIATIEYQWLRCASDGNPCDPISGATTRTYTVADADLGATLRVRVEGKDAADMTIAEVRSEATAVVEPVPTPTPDPVPDPTPIPDPTPAPPPPSDPPPSSEPPPSSDPPPSSNPPPSSDPPPSSGGTTTAQPAPPPGGVGFSQPASTPTRAPSRVLRYLRPFPVVRVAGYSVTRGTFIRLFRVTARRGARVAVSCRGKGCPVGRLVRRPGRIRQFERFLPVGVVIRVRVTRPGYIGKYVRFVIRSRAAPRRLDACLMPDRSRPARCPA